MLNRRTFLVALSAPLIAKQIPIPPQRKAAPSGPLPHQQRLLDSTAQEILLTGGRGCGRTWALKRLVEQELSRNERFAAWITVRDAQSVNIFVRDWRLAGTEWKRKGVGAIAEIGHRIVCVASRPPQYPTALSIAAWDGLLIYEDADFYLDLIDYGRGRGAGARTIISCSPPINDKRAAWMRGRFFTHPVPNSEVISAPMWENPHLWNKGYGRFVSALPSDSHERMVRGKWNA